MDISITKLGIIEVKSRCFIVININIPLSIIRDWKRNSVDPNGNYKNYYNGGEGLWQIQRLSSYIYEIERLLLFIVKINY